MDIYMNNYDSFNKTIVYNFNIEQGGIGDCLKFFMFVLETSIKNNTRLYYKKNDIEIEKYIKLKYEKMYINEEKIKQLDSVELVEPHNYYSTFNDNFSMNIKDIFYFTNEVKINFEKLFPTNIKNYISIHLRLGDKYLETEEKNFVCKHDIRNFSEEKIDLFIEENSKKNIFFCSDNKKYKLKIKEKYKNIIISDCDIGHTSFTNTTEKQVLDCITEFYILTNSEMIYAASKSGFSLMASKFNNIPLYLEKTH